MLAVLNDFHVGRVGVCPRWDEERPFSPTQDTIVRRFVVLARRLARPAVAGSGPKLRPLWDYVSTVPPEKAGDTTEDCALGPLLGGSAVPVVAARVWRTTAPPAFDPTAFLPGFELAA